MRLICRRLVKPKLKVKADEAVPVRGDKRNENLPRMVSRISDRKIETVTRIRLWFEPSDAKFQKILRESVGFAFLPTLQPLKTKNSNFDRNLSR